MFYALGAAVSVMCTDQPNTQILRILSFDYITFAGLDITILGCNDFYSYRNQVFTLVLDYCYYFSKTIMQVQYSFLFFFLYI